MILTTLLTQNGSLINQAQHCHLWDDDEDGDGDDDAHIIFVSSDRSSFHDDESIHSSKPLFEILNIYACI